MTTILELDTGVFPDAETLSKAITSRDGIDQIVHLDVRKFGADRNEDWDAVVAAILDADVVVTL